MDVISGMTAAVLIFVSTSTGVVCGVIMAKDTMNERGSSVFWTFIASILVGLAAASIGATGS